jgi:predicted 3-demethylubiquinone-9 3-methyltransferase (glyoxalase superfamily)
MTMMRRGQLGFMRGRFRTVSVDAVMRAPADFPSGKAGDVLNGGGAFKQSEAFSFQIATEDQAETDRYWNAIVGNGGKASACGWCKDKWGGSWQITPRVLFSRKSIGCCL